MRRRIHACHMRRRIPAADKTQERGFDANDVL